MHAESAVRNGQRQENPSGALLRMGARGGYRERGVATGAGTPFPFPTENGAPFMKYIWLESACAGPADNRLSNYDTSFAAKSGERWKWSLMVV